MSATAKGTISMKLIASEEETKKKIPKSKLALSLDHVTASKEQLLSVGLNISNFNHEKKPDLLSLSSHSHLDHVKSSLLPVQNSASTKLQKRTKSRPGPKSSKKGRIDTTSDSPDEKALDTDLFAFVESLDTNKNLDSDSSTSTVIFEDINNQTSNNDMAKDAEPKSYMNAIQNRTKPSTDKSMLKDIDFQVGSENHLSDMSPFAYNSFPTLSSKEYENELKLNTKEISTNFYNSSKGRVIYSEKPPLVSEGQSQSISLTPINKNIPQTVPVNSMPSNSLPNKVNNQNLNPFNIISVPVSTSQSILRSLFTNDYSVTSPLSKNYLNNKPRKKSTKIVTGAQTFEVKEVSSQSSVNAACLSVPNVCQNDQRINSQSFYASMGLDEDLCDVDDQNPLQKSNNKSTSNASSYLSCSSEYNVPRISIKTENDESSFITDINTKENVLVFDSKNEILPSNDLHVSMIFEAEPPCNEEEEDDLPLSVLKNQITTDEMIPKIKQKSDELKDFITDKMSDIHPSLFIKKELIEDEIVSESQAVSSKNLFTVSDANLSSEINPSFSTSLTDFMSVKIKTEPDADFPSSESARDFSTSASCNTAQILQNNTIIPRVYQEAKHNSVLETTISKNVCQSYNIFGNSLSHSFASKDQSEVGLNVHNVSCLPSDPSLNYKDPSLACTTVNKVSNTTDISSKRKSHFQSSKLVTENVKNSTTFDLEPNQNLPEEIQQDFKSFEDNSDLSLSQPVTDTDTESNSSKKKGKRKKSAKQSVNIDENLPITLLIKRQKSDSVDDHARDSFLCTSVTKSVTGESSSISSSDKTVSVGDGIIKSKDSTAGEIADVCLRSENLGSQQKNKKSQRRQNKKKQTRNLKGKYISSSSLCSDALLGENQSVNSLNVTLKLNDNAFASTSLLNSSKSDKPELSHHMQFSKYQGTQKENTPSEGCLNKVSAADQKDGTYVYMTFEEHSSVEEITEEDMNSVLSCKEEKDVSSPRESVGHSSNVSPDIYSVIKNIKQEKEVSLQPEPKASGEHFSISSSNNNPESNISLVDETVSTVSSVASNSNREDDSSVSALSNFDSTPSESNLNSQAKKKKRRPRSNGWYKKKKSRAKLHNFPSATVELKEPTNLSVATATKVPVVIIKNLLPQIKSLNTGNNLVEINNSLCPEQKPDELPAKCKRKKAATSRKKKKVAQLNNSSINESVLQNAISNCHEDMNNTKLSHSHLQSETVETSKRAESGNSVLCSTSTSCKSNENSTCTSKSVSNPEQINLTRKPWDINDNPCRSSKIDSEAVKSHPSLCPSLDDDQMRQEIEACDAFLQNLRNSSTDMSKQNSSKLDHRKELNIQSKVSEPNILDAFNSSYKSVESKRFTSFELFADAPIKRELDDCSKTSVYPPKEVSLFCSDKSDKLDCLQSVAKTSTTVNDCFSSNKESSVQNLNRDLPGVNLSLVKKEKDISVQDKSLSGPSTAQIRDRIGSVLDKNAINQQRDNNTDPVVNINSCATLQSDPLASITPNSQSLDIDKIALSIKKEVSVDAKSRSSNFGIKDQNDLIQKACGRQTGELIFAPTLSDNVKTKSVNSLQPISPDSKLRDNSVGDDEIQILQVANIKDSKDVPLVDLTDDNVSDSAVEIQNKISENKNKCTFTHVNTTQDNSMPSSASQGNTVQGCATQVSSSQRCATQVNIVPKSTTEVDSIRSMQLGFSQINPKNVADEFPLSKVIKSENSSFKSCVVSDSMYKEKLSTPNKNKQVITDNNKKKEAMLSSEFEATHDELESVGSKDDILKSYFMTDDPAKVGMSNSLIAREKYFEDYFKHPYPPSMVLHNTRQRNRNKMYTRINSKAWNLTLEAVESRLKLSVNPQFGKKLGDVVRLEKYPVSVSEVECYHRILGVAPSHKLLSKCFKSPDKKVSTFLNKGFSVFPGFQQGNMNKIETEKHYSQMTCSLDDIFQGIAETKKMYSNNSVKNSIAAFERDCPSAETRDSCDSYISNMSGSRDLKTPNNLNQVQSEFVQGSTFNDTNSNGRNSASSTSLPTFNETITNNLANRNFLLQNSTADQFSSSFNSNENINPPHSQNVLDYLNLPDQEAINNVNITDASPSFVGTCDSVTNGLPVLRNSTLNSIDSHASNSYQSSSTNVGFKANDESELQSEKKQAFNVVDLPVTELRKILETAGSLLSDTVNYDDGSLWKSKATFEYNHTQGISSLDSERNKKIATFEYNHTASVPSVETNSELNNLGMKVFPSEIAPGSSLTSQSVPNDNTNTKVEDLKVSEKGKSTKNTEEEDSDNDCVDNEPIINDDSDRERDEYSCHEEKHTSEERPVQYKSKWEKIMERKSLENKEKEKVNEHLLKDCFPVSSTRTRKKISNTSFKTVSKSKEESVNSKTESFPAEMQNSKVKINLKEKDVKWKNKNTLKANAAIQNDKNTSKANAAKQNVKSSKHSKEKEEKSRTKSVSEMETKNKISVSKKNRTSLDDASDLFVPDKSLKVPKVKKHDTSSQIKKNDVSKRFYGNRVTNRGTFLTVSSSSDECLKKIKIPKKKTTENPKKHFSVRSEEFHSMIKSPDINIESPFRSYKNGNKTFDSQKSAESYRSPLENTTSSTPSHFMCTKQMRDRRFNFTNFHHHERPQHHKSPILNDPRSVAPKSLHDDSVLSRKPLLSTPTISPLINDDCSMNKKNPLLSTPSSISSLINHESTLSRKTLLSNKPSSLTSHQLNDGSITGRNISLLGMLPSVSSHPSNDENLREEAIPNINIQPSISPKLPSESFQPKGQMKLLESLLSVINKSSPVSNVKEGVLPFSDDMNPSWDKREPNSVVYSCSESSVRHGMNVQPIAAGESLAFVNKSHSNLLPPEHFDALKFSSTHLVSNMLHKKQFDPPFDASDNLNSPPYSASINTGSHAVTQSYRKATCLVPQHLKTLVGHKTIATHDVRLLMLEWSVDWLVQQQQVQDPPPISNALKKVVSSYDNFEDYYNTYFPLMLLDTWHRIYVSWTHLNQASPYSCQITSYSVKKQYVSVECQTVFNTAAHPKGVFPDAGSILMVKYSTKSNEYTIKILGYVTNVKTRRFNSVTDSKLFSSLRLYKDANPDVLQILSLTFMGAYNSEDIDKRQPIRIHVLCNVKPTLKQNDAMLYINNSPLQRSILNPVVDGLLSVSLTPRNSPLEKVNDCVRDITRGILSPHPLPLLTVVRAQPESDRLNIIPLLIEKMKSTYKTKVLLCVRTVRALGDIAANICLHQSLKLVIINKRCDTNPHFQKYLLDEITSAEMNKISEDKTSEKHHAKSDLIVEVKKQVLKDCDVVLSLIRNCHDEFMCTTFTETDCVSQMCCIVDEANLCTEPETLIPILHGVSKLILIGDPDYPAKVLSKTASTYDYSQSFFQRAYDLDLITE